MKRTTFILATLLATLMIATVVSGAPAEMTLNFWSTRFDTSDPANKDKPKEEFYIYQAIKRFEEANPGVTVNISTKQGGAAYFTAYRAAGIAGNAPDVADFWSGNYHLDLKNVMLELSPYLGKDPELKKSLIGWETVTVGFGQTGDVYGVPLGNDGQCGIFYNKELLTKAGLDWDKNAPDYADQFVADLKKIKATGVTPLGFDKWSSVWQVLAYWFTQQIGSSGIDQIVQGEADFSQPAFIAAVNQWRELEAEGLLNKDIETADTGAMFVNEQVATISGCAGGIATFDQAFGRDGYGMIHVPDINPNAMIQDGGIGGVGSSLAISKRSKHPELALKFVKFLHSEEEVLHRLNEQTSDLPVRRGFDMTQVTDHPLIIKEYEWSTQPSTIFWIDNVLPSSLTDYMLRTAPLAQSGQISAEEWARRLDQERDDYLKYR